MSKKIQSRKNLGSRNTCQANLGLFGVSFKRVRGGKKEERAFKKFQKRNAGPALAQSQIQQAWQVAKKASQEAQKKPEPQHPKWAAG